jgi:hypothetical protein
MSHQFISTLLVTFLSAGFASQSMADVPEAPKRFLVYKESVSYKEVSAAITDRDADAGIADLRGARTESSKDTAFVIVDLDSDEEMAVYYSARGRSFWMDPFSTPSLQSVTLPVTVRRKTVMRRFFHFGFSSQPDFEESTVSASSNQETGSGDLASITLPALSSIGENRLIQAPRRIRLSGAFTIMSLRRLFFDSVTSDLIPGRSYRRIESKTSRSYNASMTAIANGSYGNLAGEEGEELVPGSQEYVEAAIKKYFLDRNYRN